MSTSNRNSTTAIMKEQQFGPLTIKMGAFAFTVPSERINRHTGTIDKSLAKKIRKCKTIEDAIVLGIMGIEIIRL